MTQNRSQAVMSRRDEPHDSLDYFGTPPWGTRALCEHVLVPKDWLGTPVWEPACGTGDMARPLREYFGWVEASDLHAHGYGEVRDFLIPHNGDMRVDWIVTNPPFRLAVEFARHAQAIARAGVAILVRTAWTETADRERLFGEFPPTTIAQFMGRLPINKGRPRRDAGTATAYCWVVWRKGAPPGTSWQMIPSAARAQLEYWGDYEGETGPEPKAVSRKRRAA